nr:MAG TPA: hypothetical protein [Crassvirales sp.]
MVLYFAIMVFDKQLRLLTFLPPLFLLISFSRHTAQISSSPLSFLQQKIHFSGGRLFLVK